MHRKEQVSLELRRVTGSSNALFTLASSGPLKASDYEWKKYVSHYTTTHHLEI